jgi:murein DD-endopeptidase MepM/ murein hydrolase activator NlpD
MPARAEDKTEMKMRKRAFTTLILFTLGAASVSSTPITVTVEKGDTLYSIGREYHVSVQQLLELNGILNPRNLRSGIRIVIPQTHVVKRGDTLYGISKTYGITVAELCEYNGIDENKPIKVDQVLRIPSSPENISEPQRVLERTASAANGKEDEMDRTVQEVRYEKLAQEDSDPSLLWPHSGKRKKLTGKLKGTQIEGEEGDRVIAVSSGKVVWVAPYRGYGELVMVEHGDGHIFAYGGNAETFVAVGDSVSAGTVIGSLGINPIERNAKVFFFVYKNGKPVDPEKAPRG